MTTLKRATIKSYTAGTHKATVQIAGSLSVWLDNIPVATDIAAAEVLAGRECAVLFFTDDNPQDAVVITIHNAVPSAAGGTPTKIIDADADTKVDVEQSADEDTVRVKVAGTERLVIQNAASPHVKLTGDTQIGGTTSYHGIACAPDVGGIVLQIRVPNIESTSGYLYGLLINNAGSNPKVGNICPVFAGIAAIVLVGLVAGTTPISVEALNFYNALTGGGGTAVLSEMNGVVVYPVYGFIFNATVTTARGIKVAPPNLTNSNSSVWSNVVGVDVLNQGHARVVNAYGIRIANITGASGTMYLMELIGATNTNLRVEAGDPTNPGANLGRSRMLATFNENGTMTLRRFEHKLFQNLVNGDKVVIAI